MDRRRFLVLSSAAIAGSAIEPLQFDWVETDHQLVVTPFAYSEAEKFMLEELRLAVEAFNAAVYAHVTGEQMPVSLRVRTRDGVHQVPA